MNEYPSSDISFSLPVREPQHSVHFMDIVLVALQMRSILIEPVMMELTNLKTD